jgi:hypothetical protein
MNNYPWYVYILPIIVALIGIIPAIISAYAARKSAEYAAKFYTHNIELAKATVGFSHIEFITFVNMQRKITGVGVYFKFKNVGKKTAVVTLIDCRVVEYPKKTVSAPGKITSKWPVMGGGLVSFHVSKRNLTPVDKLSQIPKIVYAVRLLYHPESEPGAVCDRRYHFLFQGSEDIPYLNDDIYGEIADLLPEDFRRI